MNQNFVKVVELLRIEAQAIERTAGSLSETAVTAALGLIAQCAGKIVLLGVGKSGVIAQKIAQTMTSTGTVAVFVHPSDALHGGLGVITTGDVVIALSNSGETEEIVTLLPALKQRGVSLIAIVGRVDSMLARSADVVLDASVDQEACPLNLAPTTSTTVALAIGDALAMTLMEEKGWTAEDFASNHPAGNLGKRLTLRVSDLMHESPNVSPDAGWMEVVATIGKFGLGAVNVTDENARLLGIVTDGDLRRVLEKTLPENFGSLTAAAMMTASPVTVGCNVLAYDALKLMENRPSQISVLPVVDDSGVCQGLLRLHDVVKSGL